MKLVLPFQYRTGLGYSPASGPQVGGAGLGVMGDPSIYSSTFFGSDVKGLFPDPKQNFNAKKSAFGKKRRKSATKRRKTGRKTGRKSKKSKKFK